MSVCREIQELIPWYVEGVLGSEESVKVASHLAECAACREDLAVTLQLRLEVRGALESLPRVPESIRAATLRTVRGRRLAKLDVGSFLVGLSLGANLRNRSIPMRGDLRVMGRTIPLFNTGRKTETKGGRE
jgi:predicted anti-sigma-YlaC factor YlaD